MMRALKQQTQAFIKDKKGVGAIEFAIIFPVLLVLYLGAFELTVAFNIYKRTASTAGSIGDLVAHQPEVSKAFLATSEHLAAAIFMPYKATDMSIKITGIEVDDKSVARVKWSWEKGKNAPYAVNSAIALPSSMSQPKRFFIRTELSISHAILRFLTSSETAIQPITISNDDLYEKRHSDPILCKDC